MPDNVGDTDTVLNPCRYCCQKSWGGDCDVMILAAVQATFWSTRGGLCLFLMFVCDNAFYLRKSEKNFMCPGFNLRVPPGVGANRHMFV